MKTMYVYILQCVDKSYYIGVTNDLERRILEHQSGKNMESYTYSRRPISLVYYEQFNSSAKAIAFEKQIKGWNRLKKEALIKKQYDLLPALSKSHTQSSTSSD